MIKILMKLSKQGTSLISSFVGCVCSVRDRSRLIYNQNNLRNEQRNDLIIVHFDTEMKKKEEEKGSFGDYQNLIAVDLADARPVTNGNGGSERQSDSDMHMLTECVGRAGSLYKWKPTFTFSIGPHAAQ